MNIRDALAADAGGIARVSVDTWRATYQGIMPDTVLEGLSYKTRENARPPISLRVHPAAFTWWRRIKNSVSSLLLMGTGAFRRLSI
jgi:hypothetical protein